MDEEMQKYTNLLDEKYIIKNFTLPRFCDFPKVNLYLDQAIEVIIDALKPLFGDNQDKWITSTMIGNYVKQKALPRPVGKRYSGEHLAYLIYIYLAKQVLSISEIKALIEIQQQSKGIEDAYNYFCNALEVQIKKVFLNLNQEIDECENLEQVTVNNLAIAVANKLYLNQYLKMKNETLAKENLHK